jgi:hypothetical protein
LLSRAEQSPDNEARAISWLAQAAATATAAKLLDSIHDEVRRRRKLSPAAFDAEWAARVGTTVPKWAAVDPTTLNTARDWVETITYAQEAAFLARHSELLEVDADPAVREAVLGLPNSEAERLLYLRQQARTWGVEAAYRTLKLQNLAADFVQADLDRQRQLLRTFRDDLHDPRVTKTILQWADKDNTWEVAGALALLSLSADDQPSGSVDALLDAVANIAELKQLLKRTAIAGQPATLSSLAKYGRLRSTTATLQATCEFFLGVVSLLVDNADHAAIWIAAASQHSPGMRAEWIMLAAEIGRSQPKVLGAIPLLTRPAHPDQNQD